MGSPRPRRQATHDLGSCVRRIAARRRTAPCAFDADLERRVACDHAEPIAIRRQQTPEERIAVLRIAEGRVDHDGSDPQARGRPLTQLRVHPLARLRCVGIRGACPPAGTASADLRTASEDRTGRSPARDSADASVDLPLAGGPETTRSTARERSTRAGRDVGKVLGAASGIRVLPPH